MSVLFPEDSLFYRAKNNFAALEAKKKTLSHTHGWSARRHAAHTPTTAHTPTDRWGEQSVSTDKLNNRSVFFPLPSSVSLLSSDVRFHLPAKILGRAFPIFFLPRLIHFAIACASTVSASKRSVWLRRRSTGTKSEISHISACKNVT